MHRCLQVRSKFESSVNAARSDQPRKDKFGSKAAAGRIATVKAATRRHDYRNYITRLLDMAEISPHRCLRNMSSHVVSGHGLERGANRCCLAAAFGF